MHNFVQTIRNQIIGSIRILEDDIRHTQLTGDSLSCHSIDLHIKPTTLKINEIIQENMMESIHSSVNLEHERMEKTTLMTIFLCDSVGCPIVDSTRNRDPTIWLNKISFRLFHQTSSNRVLNLVSKSIT